MRRILVLLLCVASFFALCIGGYAEASAADTVVYGNVITMWMMQTPQWKP